MRVGDAVSFSFTLFRVTQTDPYVNRTGTGVVIGTDNYTVWPCPGYSVRVTDSPDYASGEVVAVTSVSLRLLTPAER